MVMALAWEYCTIQSSPLPESAFFLHLTFVIAASIQFCFDHQKASHVAQTRIVWCVAHKYLRTAEVNLCSLVPELLLVDLQVWPQRARNSGSVISEH